MGLWLQRDDNGLLGAPHFQLPHAARREHRGFSAHAGARGTAIRPLCDGFPVNDGVGVDHRYGNVEFEQDGNGESDGNAQCDGVGECDIVRVRQRNAHGERVGDEFGDGDIVAF